MDYSTSRQKTSSSTWNGLTAFQKQLSAPLQPSLLAKPLARPKWVRWPQYSRSRKIHGHPTGRGESTTATRFHHAHSQETIYKTLRKVFGRLGPYPAVETTHSSWQLHVTSTEVLEAKKNVLISRLIAHLIGWLDNSGGLAQSPNSNREGQFHSTTPRRDTHELNVTCARKFPKLCEIVRPANMRFRVPLPVKQFSKSHEIARRASMRFGVPLPVKH